MRNFRQNPDPRFFYSGDLWTPIFQAEPACPCHQGKTELGTAATNRIRESLRLEKTSKIIKSNHHPNTSMPAKPCPQVPHLHIFEPLQGWWLHHLLGQPGPMPDHSLSTEIFPSIQSKPPLMQLEAISSCPIASYLGEETDTRLATISFQVFSRLNKPSSLSRSS